MVRNAGGASEDNVTSSQAGPSSRYTAQDEASSCVLRQGPDETSETESDSVLLVSASP
jgi:hypothetical protein